MTASTWVRNVIVPVVACSAVLVAGFAFADVQPTLSRSVMAASGTIVVYAWIMLHLMKAPAAAASLAVGQSGAR